MYANLSQLLSDKPVRRVRLLALLLLLAMTAVPALRAQATATISGIVTDPKAALIVGATVTLTNEATQDVRETRTNGRGLYVFTGLDPSTYTIKVVSEGFAPKELTGIELHGGDEITAPTFALPIGTVNSAVTVETASQIMTTSTGERNETLTYQDIQDIALEGRDLSEVLKVLPGVSVQTSGNAPIYNPQSETTGQSAIGQGLNTNGAPNRGGTTLMVDGVSVLDPGADFSSLVTVNPEMTQEVNVLSTNFGADTAFGPVVVNTTSRSGGVKYHGQGYLNARNDVLNANDWVDNHTIPVHAKAGAAYYYPGGSISGPVPHTNKKLFFFGAFELLYQNQGLGNILKGYIPTPEMLGGDFSTDNADNLVLCPYGFYNTNNNSSTTPGWCNNITNSNGNTSFNTIFADGTMPTISTSAVPTAPAGTTQGFAGGKIPAQYMNQNSVALASLWPKWGTNPYVATTAAQIAANGGFNYYQPIINHDNGWIYRARIDYNPTETSKFYIAYQQGYDRQLANGAGTNIYSTGTLQFPGGGLYKTTYSKIISGHFVHIFNSTTTNEAIASWVYGSIPTAPPNPSADYRSTIGFNVPTVYGGSSLYAPTYGSSTYGYPGITQADIFEPGGFYTVEKTIPTYADNFTKVWGKHTIKVGGFASNTDNFQGNMSTNLQGSLTYSTGNTVRTTLPASAKVALRQGPTPASSEQTTQRPPFFWEISATMRRATAPHSRTSPTRHSPSTLTTKSRSTQSCRWKLAFASSISATGTIVREPALRTSSRSASCRTSTRAKSIPASTGMALIRRFRSAGSPTVSPTSPRASASRTTSSEMARPCCAAAGERIGSPSSTTMRQTL